MKVIIMVCTKKKFRTNGPFWARKLDILMNSGLAARIFFKSCRLKGADRYLKILLVFFFLRKKLIWCNLIFLAFRPFFYCLIMGMVKLSHATVNRMLKQSEHDFFHIYNWILKKSGHE